MSPELGFVLFVTLLCGPTAIWLGYRAIRGHEPRTTHSGMTSGPEPVAQRTGAEVDAEVARDGFWVCWTCRSLNRQGSGTCYACHTAMGSADRPAQAEHRTTSGIPVMAAATTLAVGRAPAATPTLAGGGHTAAATTLAVGRAPAATPTLAGGGQAVPAPTLVAREPAPMPVPVYAAGPAAADGLACPFLGFRHDPSTRCDFPDPRNVCHARPARGAVAFLARRRAATGAAVVGRSKVIGAEHQRSTCLSAGHVHCPRYSAVPAVEANR